MATPAAHGPTKWLAMISLYPHGMHMAVSSLKDIDLNLLLTLRILLEESSVKGAAARLGVTQSAVSHSLAKLRELLDDPLLVRTSRGMRPTGRAEQLVAPLARAFAELEYVVADRGEFDPMAHKRTFRLQATDFSSITVLPSLMQRLQQNGPHIDVIAKPRSSDVYSSLEADTLDVAIGRYATAPAGFFRKTLFEEHFACLVRDDHPKIGDKLDLDTYQRLTHLLVAPVGTPYGVVDDVLAARGMRRRVGLAVPHFLVAPLVVSQTDLVLTVPSRIARKYSSIMPLTMLKPPIELPTFAIIQLWHERRHRDPAHQWFRNEIAEAAREV